MAPAKELAERLGLEFDDLGLLSQALVHSSYVHEQPLEGPSNERLEFLGDSVISIIVSEALFQRYPDEDEGSLTTRRAAIVSARGLARIAQRLELDTYLILGLGATAAGEKSRKSVLAATFEAVTGAIYLAHGMDGTRQWLLDVAAPELEGRTDVDDLKPPKSVLQELSYRRTGRAPQYRTISEEGPPHARHYVVEALVAGESLGRGEGRNRRDAETEAAREAMTALDAAKSARPTAKQESEPEQ
ncbi:MAG TPA: ribonuclease III [Candidatus Limnocylindrales bacterium]|nr:ribonuclease III [Candidatus Limnocylindrales bacterium]